MTTPLTIVATIEALPEFRDQVKAELLKLIAPTQQEAGFIQYDLHQDNEDPNRFVFFENWESKTLWEAHMGNQHLADYMKATDGMVANFTLFQMSKV